MKYHQKVLPFPEFDYLVAVCPIRIGKQVEDEQHLKKNYCHKDCELHAAVFSSEIRQKFIVGLLCIPNDSPEVIAIAKDIMERMKLSKTQPQIKEFLGINEKGFPIERIIDIKPSKNNKEKI